MEKFEAFKRELTDLLAKYDAALGAGVGEGSDTYGIYDEHLTVTFYRRDESDRFRREESRHRISEGWSITP